MTSFLEDLISRDVKFITDKLWENSNTFDKELNDIIGKFNDYMKTESRDNLIPSPPKDESNISSSSKDDPKEKNSVVLNGQKKSSVASSSTEGIESIGVDEDMDAPKCLEVPKIPLRRSPRNKKKPDRYAAEFASNKKGKTQRKKNNEPLKKNSEEVMPPTEKEFYVFIYIQTGCEDAVSGLENIQKVAKKTDEETVQTPQKTKNKNQIFSPFDKVSTKSKVEDFEKLTTNSPFSKTKTGEDEPDRHLKQKQGTPLGFKLTVKGGSALKASRAELSEREKYREEALKKRKAYLQKMSEDIRKKREERHLKAQQQRAKITKVYHLSPK